MSNWKLPRKNWIKMIEIITIGDEILIGQIVDTNSAWMSVQLNKAGFPISQITSVHDDEEQILNTLNRAISGNDIVLITGGLGPTKDDITKLTLCSYFKTRLVFDESVYQHITKLYSHRPSVMNELTRTQAMVPENCTIIQNSVGTAPIMWFEPDGKVVVSMPGVPFEMQKVLIEEIIPRLSARFPRQHIVHQTVQVYGYGESDLAIKIADWENALPSYLHLAYLPSFGIVKLRLSGLMSDKELLEREMESQFEKLSDRLGESIVAYDDLPIEHTLSTILRQKKLTISTAESCTGGNVARRITLIPGSSDIFKGSVVAYDNSMKANVLGVSESDLMEFGAVSKEVVEQMAEKVRILAGSDLSVAVSGIAGPSGGTAEKPVGTVWIAVAIRDDIVSKKFQFGDFPREVIIERSTTAALMMVLNGIKSLQDNY